MPFSSPFEVFFYCWMAGFSCSVAVHFLVAPFGIGLNFLAKMFTVPR